MAVTALAHNMDSLAIFWVRIVPSFLWLMGVEHGPKIILTQCIVSSDVFVRRKPIVVEKKHKAHSSLLLILPTCPSDFLSSSPSHPQFQPKPPENQYILR